MGFVSSPPIHPESKALVLYTGLGYMALKTSFYGQWKTSFYGQWNSILVEYTCGSLDILHPDLSVLCQQKPDNILSHTWLWNR